VHVLLLGLRSSGKSTLAPLLAARLNLPHLDLDDATAALLDAPSCADALNRRGEPAFRAAERQALAHALTLPAHVIALGGGTPTAPGAADLIQDATRERRAVTIYLRATPQTLETRLRATDLATRPALTGTDALAELPALFAARDPLYTTLALHTIQIDDRTITELLQGLLKATVLFRAP